VASFVLLQVVLVTASIVVYFRVRGLTAHDAGTAMAHGRDLLAAEHRLGLAWEQDLQSALLRWDGVTMVANWIYIYGHWPVIVATLVWLAVQHREQYVLLRDAMLTSGTVGLVIFASYPMAPPRLLDAGFLDTVSERSQSYRVLQPAAFVNQFAAMPSLHAGWDLIVGLSIAAAASHAWLRWAGRILPVLMALAVVVTGNHYVLDVVAGCALALAGLACSRVVHGRHDRDHVERGEVSRP
jgi:membrane-associated phospholipid phosphatase